mgnify:CR=1 FL=1
MSYSCVRKGGIIPIEASVDLSQGQLVKLVADKAAVCTASDEPFGVATEAFLAGEQASIAIAGAVDGTVWLVADGVIARGAKVKPAASGRAASATTGLIVGRALEAATAQGELIECALLTPVTVA